MVPNRYKSVLRRAKQEIANYLEDAKAEGRIDGDLLTEALDNTYTALEQWMSFPEIPGISDSFKDAIADHIEKGDWKDIVNAFRQRVRFGTGGIRGMMAFDRKSILRIKEDGLDAPILKGPNTINDLVISLTTTGVAQFGRDQHPPFQRVVIGYDSRVRGFDLAKVVARVFLGYDYTVYFFDAPCPYPEVTYAIPHKQIKADVGVLISASHND